MKVNYRQISMIVFMSFIALKFLALPALLFQDSEYMSWFTTLMLMIVDGLYAIMILSLIKRNRNKNIYEFLKEIFGAIFAKIIIFLICLHLIVIMLDLTKGLKFFVVENLYNEFKWYMFILPLVAVVGFMMYKGIRNMARVLEMFFWPIVIGCIYIALKSASGVDVLVFLPFFRDGFMPVFTSAYNHAVWFGSATFLIMLMGNVDFSLEKKSQFIRYVVFSVLLVMLVYFVFYGLFGITSPIHNYCLIDLSQYYTGSSSINELSWFVVSLWIVAQSVQLAIYGFCLMRGIIYIFNIKQPILPITVIGAGLIFWTYLGDVTINLEKIFFSNAVIISLIVIQYIIPLIIVIADLIKRKTKKKKVVKHEKVKVRV